MRSAHPRSRGENHLLLLLLLLRFGSSPLTRGKRREDRFSCAGLGLIPAHAGKTAGILSSIFFTTAHPRSRGENVSDVNVCAVSAGSSPLTRGKRVAVAVAAEAPGLIPAHAGKTSAFDAVRSARAAHPRSRGENQLSDGERLGGHGSSPLTRGKPSRPRPRLRGRRLIPAHAGKTRSIRCMAFCGPAHPRSRGENIIMTKIKRLVSGSSPLTRGKRLRGCRSFP